MTTARNRNLGGAAPDRAAVALIVLDMISDFRFEDGAQVARATLPVARRIAALRRRAGAAGVPVIYANDNHGRWRSDFRALLRRSAGEGSLGAPIARLLMPSPRDYLVLKPKHSAFFGTVLDPLLQHLGVRRLVLTGVTAHQCVLFTANDAYIRDLGLHIPGDCIAAESPAKSRFAMRYFREVLGADLSPSARVRFVGVRKTGRGRAADRPAGRQAGDRD